MIQQKKLLAPHFSPFDPACLQMMCFTVANLRLCLKKLNVVALPFLRLLRTLCTMEAYVLVSAGSCNPAYLYS
jgi:hypothetical protein